MTWGRPASLLAVLVLAGCRKVPDAAASADAMAAAALPVEASAVAPPSPVVAARCRPTGGGAAIAQAEGLELGDEIPFAEGTAIGVVHRTAAGRVMAVVLVDRDVTSARVIDLGMTPGDAPPPRVTRHGDDVLVAGATVLAGGDARALTVLRVTASGDVTSFATIPQPRDEAPSFDLGSDLVAWDETADGAPPRGIIHVAQLASPGGRAGRELSQPDADAEMPRVVARGAGYFVLWIARRPEPIGALDASEATGEARAFSWLEEANVDATGVPSGPPRHLTPTSGHVSAYDVEALGAAAADGRPSLLAVARDDGEAVDGSGGALLRVRVRDDGADPPLVLAGDGLGRGAPWLVDGPLPWIAWVGPHEELRLLPLDAAGLPLASPSAEPLLDDALPLAMLAGSAVEERMLVAFPGGDPAAALRLFACTH
jgi:hypothetical protein